MQKKQQIDKIFLDIQEKLWQWIKKKPTGQFSIHLNFNEGGLRGKPEITIREKL